MTVIMAITIRGMVLATNKSHHAPRPWWVRSSGTVPISQYRLGRDDAKVVVVVVQVVGVRAVIRMMMSRMMMREIAGVVALRVVGARAVIRMMMMSRMMMS